MKTPNLDKLAREWKAGWTDIEPSVRAAVAEDIREACERAWLEGYHAPDGSYDKNPYRKAGK